MLGSSTLLTPGDLPNFIQTFRQPRTQMPLKITSRKMVIIVNMGSTKFPGVPRQIKTTSITTL
uniref:AC4 n=1 Tax=Pepper golden mosaic virus TaxID=223301 RepID=A0A6B9TLA7_9GEMI|nr:AC4 [Pepper golden mosaic virus]